MAKAWLFYSFNDDRIEGIFIETDQALKILQRGDEIRCRTEIFRIEPASSFGAIFFFDP
jgi:hypothetical protein